jgi:hypothetical protein
MPIIRVQGSSFTFCGIDLLIAAPLGNKGKLFASFHRADSRWDHFNFARSGLSSLNSKILFSFNYQKIIFFSIRILDFSIIINYFYHNFLGLASGSEN